MARRASRTPQARRDLSDIATYIGMHNETASASFLSAVEADLDNLAAFPGLGARREFSKSKLRDMRSWPVSGYRNYLIFYQPTKRGIRVIRVLHGARNLEDVFAD